MPLDGDMEMDEDLDGLYEPARKLVEKYGIRPGNGRINYVAEGLKSEEILWLIREHGFERIAKCYSEPGKVKLGAMKEGEWNGIKASYLLFSEPITENHYRLLEEELG